MAAATASSEVPAFLLRIDEAERRSSLSRTKLYDLMSAGLLAYAKIGRSRRIVASSLDALIHNSIVGGAK
jgi:excisionase family DNA binding protein